MGNIGEKLRSARESSKRTIREMFDQTKIRADHLEALEEGRYDVFSAPVYIRGFVRSYAGALRLNVAETLLQRLQVVGADFRLVGHFANCPLRTLPRATQLFADISH